MRTVTLGTVPLFMEVMNQPERGAHMRGILPGSDPLWHLLSSSCRGSSPRTGGKRQTTAATAPALETLQRRSIM